MIESDGVVTVMSADVAAQVLAWARRFYPRVAARCPCGGALCRACDGAWAYLEATAIAYDMAVAAESDDRIRRSVAW